MMRTHASVSMKTDGARRRETVRKRKPIVKRRRTRDRVLLRSKPPHVPAKTETTFVGELNVTERDCTRFNELNDSMTKFQKFRRKLGDPSKYAMQNLVAAKVILERAGLDEDGSHPWAQAVLAGEELRGTTPRHAFLRMVYFKEPDIFWGSPLRMRPMVCRGRGQHRGSDLRHPLRLLVDDSKA